MVSAFLVRSRLPHVFCTPRRSLRARRPPSDENFETPVYEADPEEVRAELNQLLAEMRAAETMPWDAKRTALYRTIVPQMANWLPEDEAKQLCFEFETELKRLEAA